MQLATGQRFAEKIASELSPFCDKIEIAGSIRRRCPVVNDIDLVILAKDKAAIKARCRRSCRVQTDGEQTFICCTENGIQIDIWFATPPTADMFEPLPSNWGSLLLCRTGSKGHNIYLVEHAKKQGLTWSPYAGVYDAALKLVASESEQAIFAALQLPFKAPEERS